MKIAIISDQHFGFKKGSKIYHDFFLKFYEEVFFPVIDKLGITTIVDMGDTFDSRKGIDFGALAWAKDNYYDRLAKRGITVHTIVGNHTAYYKNTNEVNAVDLLLREYDNVKVYPEVQDVKLGNLDAVFVPWINSDNAESTYKTLRQSKSRVVMGHLELNGFRAHRGHIMEDGHDAKIYEKFDKVFSGHYHTRSDDGRIFYLGNPYQMFWSDVNDKRGFVIFDTETLEHKYLNNPNELYKIVNYNNTPRQTFNYQEYAGKIVKLIVEKRDSHKEYEKFIDGFNKVDLVDLNIVDQTININDAELNIDEFEDTLSILDKYVDELEFTLNKSTLKSILRQTYQEACNVT
jgi:hypothetical protein